MTSVQMMPLTVARKLFDHLAEGRIDADGFEFIARWWAHAVADVESREN